MTNNGCIICETRPAREHGYCHNCADKIEAIRRAAQSPQAYKYLTYRGHVVGLYTTGKGQYKPVLIPKRNPSSLPRSRTLDLNTWLDGFDREQVRKMKRCVLQLAGES